MINNEAVEVTKELFASIKNRYQNNLESVKGSEFALDYIHLLCYKCHKINLNCGGSYVDSLNWIRNRNKATKNTTNKRDHKCCQYAATVELNLEGKGKHTERRLVLIKSDKAPFIIYTDLECIIETIYGCKNNLGNLSTTKVSKHIPSGFSISTISSCRSIENKYNKYDVYRGKDCMKKFCESLREHAMKIINSKKNKMKLLTIRHICKDKRVNKYFRDRKYCKVSDHCHYIGGYRGAVHSICNLKYTNEDTFA